MRSLIAVLLTAFLLTAAGGSALACEMAGKNKHIGNIVAVDPAGKSFVILDAETRSEIRFVASQETLSSLAVDDQVQVSYEESAGGELVTLEVIRI